MTHKRKKSDFLRTKKRMQKKKLLTKRERERETKMDFLLFCERGARERERKRVSERNENVNELSFWCVCTKGYWSDCPCSDGLLMWNKKVIVSVADDQMTQLSLSKTIKRLRALTLWCLLSVRYECGFVLFDEMTLHSNCIIVLFCLWGNLSDFIILRNNKMQLLTNNKQNLWF